MRDQAVILQTNYVEFTFNGGLEIVQFDNFEILGDLEYFPPTTQEIQQSESGATFSLSKKQVEKFRFEFNYDKTSTRRKIEILRKHIYSGYSLTFKVSAFPTIFGGTNFLQHIPTDLEPNVSYLEFELGKSVISLPSDFSFDRSARGEGMTILDGIECIVSKSATLPVPASECSLVSNSDFDFAENVDPGTLELISFTLSPNAGGLIGTIDGTVSGTITYISGGSGSGSTSSTISYNGAQSRYEPDSGPFILDGLYTITLNGIPITLDSGQVCSFDFQTSIQYLINTPPVASNVLIAGTAQQGQTLSLSWTYSDAQSDAEDTSAAFRETWFSFPTQAEADAADLTNADQIGVASTYLLTGTEVGKWIRARVRPQALTGNLVGSDVWSNVIGPIVTNVVAFTYQTTKNGQHDLQLQAASATPLGIDFGDGSPLVTLQTDNTLSTYSKSYSDSSVKTVSVYCDPSIMRYLDLTGESLSGTMDLSNMVGLAEIYLQNESALANLSLGTGTLSNLNVKSTGLINLDFPSGIVFNSASLLLQNGNLETVTFTGKSGTIGQLDISNAALNGVLDLGGLNFSAAQIYLDLNSSLTGITSTGATGTTARLYFDRCNITGVLTWEPEFAGNVLIYGYTNPLLTDFVFTVAAGSPSLRHFRFSSCNLQTNPDLSAFNCDGAVTISVSGNSSVTNINFGTGNSGDITTIGINSSGCGFVSLGGYQLLDVGGSLDADDAGLTAAEVNEWLYNLDPTAGGEQILKATNSTLIDLAGTANAAPDSTSGGFDGLLHAANIAASGSTLLTN